MIGTRHRPGRWHGCVCSGREHQRDECRRRPGGQLTMSILPPPCRQQRTRHTVPPGRRRNLAVPQKALLHHPELVSIAPVSPARGIRGRQHFYLGSELTVGHKVGRITDLEIPSDGLRRRDTHHPWQAPSLEELAHELLGGRSVAARLHEDVQHLAVGIDCPPEPLLRAVDLEDDLVEVPLVGWPGPVAPDLRSNLRPELRDPGPDRLVGNDHPALREKILDIAQAQGKAMVRPDSVTDDGAREAMPLEAGEVVEI